MPTFAPPSISEAPPTLPEGTPGQTEGQVRLFRYYRARPAGVNVYLYKAGSLSAIEHGRVTEDDPVALYDADGVMATTGWEDIEVVFWGGHDPVEVTCAQAELLNAAGYDVALCTTEFTESFTAPNGPLSGLDQPWTTNADRDAEIFSGTFSAVYGGSFGDGQARCDSDVGSNDMSTQVSLAAVSATQNTVSLFVRMESGTFDDTTGDFIEGAIQIIPSNCQISFNARVSGSYNTVDAIVVSGEDTQGSHVVLLGADVIAGDVLRLAVVDNALTFYINDEPRANGFTGLVPTGSLGGIGITYFGVDHSGRLDNFIVSSI